ncbi:MAG TPA: FMN-binding protein, partial [Pirellulales bacterium]|nr:FMN-binding protein [Pirellulales bacterium]
MSQTPLRGAGGFLRPWRSWLVHALRIGLLAAIVVLIHWQHERWLAREQSRSMLDDAIALVEPLVPDAAQWGDVESHGGRQLLADDGRVLGFAVQTSPEGDKFLGFSGPTNLLIVFDTAERVVGTAVVSSRDTRDHVDLIRRNARFLKSWTGRSWNEAADAHVDGVAGATLTSLAIVQSLRKRLGGVGGSLKFPEPLTVADAQTLFPKTVAVEQDTSLPALWHVRDADGREIGLILRTSPAADEIVGYQGPTDARIGIAPDGKIMGVVIGKSYDNEPYVGYARGDEYFR